VGEGKEALAYGRVAAAFLPRELRPNDNVPSHRVFVGRPEIGAAWSKCDGARLLVPLWRSQTLARIYTNLFDDADGRFSRPVPQTSAE
jgi:uncharacterized protein (DUF736 family)